MGELVLEARGFGVDFPLGAGIGGWGDGWLGLGRWVCWVVWARIWVGCGGVWKGVGVLVGVERGLELTVSWMGRAPREWGPRLGFRGC